jgi:hypothetical protein
MEPLCALKQRKIVQSAGHPCRRPHASTLFDYIHRAMPLHAPGSLSADEVYAVSAYILSRGGILPEDAELNAQSFKEIEMPNAGGFMEDPRPNAM